jgi:acyl-CoA synthetase (AMP-forming)/AMP-acid ligase II
MWVYPEIRLLGDLPAYYARHEPRRTAFLSGGRRIDFEEFESSANRVAQGLVSSGVEPENRVFYLGKNSLDYFLAMFGVIKAGCCFTPLNWRLSIGELAAIINDADGICAFVESAFESVWERAIAQSGMKVAVHWIDHEMALENAYANVSKRPLKMTTSEDDGAVQLYTSGTTGLPKGVVLTHGCFNRMRLCEHLDEAFDWRDGDSFLYALPNFHLLGLGLSLQCLYNGVAVNICPQFDPPQMLQAISRERPSLLVLAPTMIQMLLDHPSAATTDFTSLRLTMYAGSPISPELLRRAMTAMPCDFMQFYGATETSGAVCLLRPDDHDLSNEQRLKSCGRPLPLISLRIVNSDGQDVGPNVAGELLVRSPSIAAGYWRQPEATQEAFLNGWYRTGDIAYQDEEGYFYLVDRAKDMIVSGGENIYTVEIENVLLMHHAIDAVAVIGIPDPRWGEAVTAIVVVASESSLVWEEVLNFCRERLASYKLPKRLEIVESLPLTGSGKISKKKLRDRYWPNSDRAIG